MAFWSWSKTAATNASADTTINWAEGQAPSSVNDSARAMMARLGEYRDDISGATQTAGTSTAYTLSTFQVFDSFAHMNNQLVAFTPHATNGATVTLNVDGLGAIPLRSAPGVEMPAGTIIAGTPYLALYTNFGGGTFYLHGFYGNPYNIPLAGGLPFFGGTAPNSSFVFPFGQAISRTTYSALFSLLGGLYGTGDGSTTFNIPDLRGRVPAGADSMGGSAANRLTTAGLGGSAVLGAGGGSETETLTAAQIPSITSSGNNTISMVAAGNYFPNATSPGGDIPTVTTGTQKVPGNNSGFSWTQLNGTSNSIAVTSNNTSGTAHINVQPTLCCNYIMRII